MLFTEQHEAILLMPPPIGGAQHFAMNLFSSLGTNAAERILMAWLQAGSADDLHRQFASQYDGAFPPNPSSLDQGFSITFMTLFQMLVTENIYAAHHPMNAAKNR